MYLLTYKARDIMKNGIYTVLYYMNYVKNSDYNFHFNLDFLKISGKNS